MPSFRFGCLTRSGALVALLLGGGGAQALELSGTLDYQVHGFASQGLVVSHNNDYLKGSRKGSVAFHEVGINVSLKLSPELLIGAQAISRRAGEISPDADVRLDYAVIDYRLHNVADSRVGLRVGRVRQPYGLYNDTRDVLFNRPSILLPQSIYLESQGAREIIFASDGIQAYGEWDGEDTQTRFVIGVTESRNIDRDTQQGFVSAQNLGGDIRIRNAGIAQFQHDRQGGRHRFSAAWSEANLRFDPDPGNPFPQTTFPASQILLSYQFNEQDWSFTTEYTLQSIRGVFAGQRFSRRAEGGYLQFHYRFLPELTGLFRYDTYFNDRKDRNGNRLSADTGLPDYLGFSHDWTIGLQWNPSSNWALWAEFHYIDGAVGVPIIDNGGNPFALERYWNIFTVMAAYRF